MNCFAHSYRFLQRDPWFITGTVLPDWLGMIARKSRIRSRLATGHTADHDRQLAELARGVVQHHHDDDWFHTSREFVELNMKFALQLRELLSLDAGFRPHIVGHIVIEMLLDSHLAESELSSLERFYAIIGDVDADSLQHRVNQMAPQPTQRIADFHRTFVEEAWLYDYLEDSRVRYRMNRVLGRVGLKTLPESFTVWVGQARRIVYDLANKLLAEPVARPGPRPSLQVLPETCP